MKIKFILIFPVAVILQGCASSYYGMELTKFGKQDFSGEAYVTAHKDNPIQADIYVAEPPSGINNDGTLIDAKYKHIAKAYFSRSTDRFGFVSFNEPWRKYYCPVNITLTYATLGVYGLTGLQTPCFYEKSHSSRKRIEERKRTIIRESQLIAQNIGADLIYIPTFGSSIESTTSSVGNSFGSAYANRSGTAVNAFGSGVYIGKSSTTNQNIPVDSANVFFYKKIQ